MTNLNDPNGERFRNRREAEETRYTGWIIGAVIALAVIVGIFALSNRGDKANTAAQPTSPPTSTTGSATPDATPKTDPADPAKPAPAQPAPAR